MQKLNSLFILILLFSLAMMRQIKICGPQTTGNQPSIYPQECQSSVPFLVTILRNNREIRRLLNQSIAEANEVIPPGSEYYSKWQIAPVTSVESYVTYVAEMEKYVPFQQNFFQELVFFYFLIDQPAGRFLQETQPMFSQFINLFVDAYGCFLDSPDSIVHLNSMIASCQYNLTEYIIPASGFRTFNEFFSREIIPWNRPVTAIADNSILVSPADCLYQGQWPIDNGPGLHVKGTTLFVSELLNGTGYADLFAGGTFTHCFLNVTDYHRYHTPTGGKVISSQIIEGHDTLKTTYDPDSLSIVANDSAGWQQLQTRGFVLLQNNIFGYVAAMPIGMAQVDGVNLYTTPGANVGKGNEFGYFKFGGSDFILLFQKDKVKLDVALGVRKLQGEFIGRAASTKKEL